MSKDSWIGWYKDRKIEDGIVNLAKLLQENQAKHVLDLGCGTGRNTVYLAHMGFHVYGFDWSENAVAMTQQELSKQKLTANLQIWDMNNVPYPYSEGFFDGVLAMRVIHHTYLKNIKQIASEIERITKPGGILYLEVPTYEKAMRPNLYGSKSLQPEPGTFIPSEGDEIGIPHHHFKKDELSALFPSFVAQSMDEKYEHYRLTMVRN